MADFKLIFCLFLGNFSFFTAMSEIVNASSSNDFLLDLRFQNITLTLTSNHLLNKTSFETIDLSHNNLEFITSHLLEGLKNLKTLKIDENKNFKPRKVEAFLHSASLTYFSCSGCGFQEIYEKTFTGLPNLEVLDLSRNQLKSIDSKIAFQSNEKLNFVNFSSNFLDFIHPETFSANKNLQILDLSMNAGLKAMQGNFLSNSHLEILYLRGCNFDVLDENTFSALPNLREIYLQNNKIRKVSAASFDKNTILAKISFEMNFLEQLPLQIITNHTKNLCLDANSFKLTRGYVRLYTKYEKYHLIHGDEATICENRNETLKFEWFVIKHKLVNMAGISDAFIGTYISAIVVAEIVVLVALVGCFMKLSKKFKPEDLSQTILNESSIYKIIKND
ncbi:leucine-rich repeat transmembrane neuronal protein 4-like [Culicoides brevitarsis]|uniref:leucine-rich repeat transmembrane neuronal protein 4-like n=1 Tax=Culicoides brevitarsis TaxID=469753 RepID=UPI00307C17D4